MEAKRDTTQGQEAIIQARVSAETRRRLRYLAAKNDTTVSEEIRRAVDAHVEPEDIAA